MKERAHLIWGLILSAIGALGTFKTLALLSTGTEFSLPRVAFYIGTTAFFVYAGAFIGLVVVGGVLVMILTALVGEQRVEEHLMTPILVIACVVALITAGAFVFSGGWDYDELDAVGRGFGALLGLAAVAATIYAFRITKKSPAQE